MAYSALFISQSHGLVEMHFHIFGALAFLLVYRDWRVIVSPPASRGPSSRLHACCRTRRRRVDHARTGTSLGMVLLHAVFVVFETAVLVILSRSLETETLATAQLRVGEAVERAELSPWPTRSSVAT